MSMVWAWVRVMPGVSCTWMDNITTFLAWDTLLPTHGREPGHEVANNLFTGGFPCAFTGFVPHDSGGVDKRKWNRPVSSDTGLAPTI
jgi:hypothetical protein